MAKQSQSTAVATTEAPRRSLAEKVNTLITSEQARSFIAPFLPPGTDIQRVAATLLLAIKKDETGKLGKCTPESLVQGVARIMQWGAELGTTAYLIPFKDQAVPVRDYKFLAELSAICGYPLEGNAVREGDEFHHEYGLNPILRHVPKAKRTAAVTHAYVIVRPPHGAAPISKVMTAEEIDYIRQTYSKQWKAGPLPEWYAIKTCVRQAVKLLPKDPRLAKLVEAVEEEEAIEFEQPIAEQTSATARMSEEQSDVGAVEEDGGFLDDRDLDDDHE